ncbi:MAG: UDP-galactopyranose mutase [Firmicutes bacterium]|nr:UDP-galactopyranose mutase [Bacillota bacterium]
MQKYDYLIVGSGLFGATFARKMVDSKKRVLVIDKREQIGGNCASKNVEGIDVHLYGAHIFHTDFEDVWQFINRFTKFNNFINTPIANYNGQLFCLPFNMHTFYALWGVKTPQEAEERLAKERAKFLHITEPKNLEEKALTLVGEEIYEILIKGYTEKQWGIKATELPAFIISRLPFRLSFDNNYFLDRYQGIPSDGYNKMFKNLLDGIEVKLGVDFFNNRAELTSLAKKVVFTGRIDEYFDYSLGELAYRSLKFETEILEKKNHQGVAVINYTDSITPYTRIIEHKHFRASDSSFNIDKTVVTKEYPAPFTKGSEPYYVVNDERNNNLANQYRELAKSEKNVIFGGRLAEYKYYDMDDIIKSGLDAVEKELSMD